MSECIKYRPVSICMVKVESRNAIACGEWIMGKATGVEATETLETRADEVRSGSDAGQGGKRPHSAARDPPRPVLRRSHKSRAGHGGQTGVLARGDGSPRHRSVCIALK